MARKNPHNHHLEVVRRREARRRRNRAIHFAVIIAIIGAFCHEGAQLADLAFLALSVLCEIAPA